MDGICKPESVMDNFGNRCVGCNSRRDDGASLTVLVKGTLHHRAAADGRGGSSRFMEFLCT